MTHKSDKPLSPASATRSGELRGISKLSLKQAVNEFLDAYSDYIADEEGGDATYGEVERTVLRLGAVMNKRGWRK